MNPTILPVVHYFDDPTTLSEVEKVYNSGANGVFLISHSGDDINLLMLKRVISAKYPMMWIGINMLHTDPVIALKECELDDVDGVWVDNCGVHSQHVSDVAFRLRDAVYNTKVFGSVAFKYQKEEPDPVIAALCATALGFIPTTSGSGTGHAPDVGKIRAMSEATNGLLAVASGMTPENIHLYAPYLSHVLVSTGICDDFYHINEDKLQRLIANSKA